jgi:hypothetical protein
MSTFGAGTLVTYDPSSGVIGQPEIVIDIWTLSPSIATLSDGRVVIAFISAEQSVRRGQFVIHDPTGATNDIGPLVFGDFGEIAISSAGSLAVAPLSDGAFAIAFVDWSNDELGTLAVYDGEGTPVGQPTVFSTSSVHELSAAGLPNGTCVVAYQDGGNADWGTFVVHDPAGNQLAAPTVFVETAVDETSTAALNTGGFTIAYKDLGNQGYCGFVAYDSARTPVSAPTVLGAGEVHQPSIRARDDGTFAFAYSNEDQSYWGKLAVFGTEQLLIQRPTEHEARLWNYTDETLEIMLSVNQ